MSIFAWPLVNARMQPLTTTPAVPTGSLRPGGTATPSRSATASLTPSPSATITPPPANLAPTQPPQAGLVRPRYSPLGQGLIVIALADGDHSHLFMYRPHEQPFTRLTAGPWDDTHPMPSPDGTHLAFASNRSGFWDLFVMDLATGAVTNLTNSPEFDGSPTWSPDGRWLAYESYTGEETGLDIYIRPVDGAQAPIRLTDHPTGDFTPAWSPQGRQVAFVSTRSGDEEIWLADLDNIENRFLNVSRSARTQETHPCWSPDGNLLAWSATNSDGQQSILVWDKANGYSQPGLRPRLIGSGSWPAWSPGGEALLATLQMPNRTYLTGYDLQTTGLMLPAVALPGPAEGLGWSPASLPPELPTLLNLAAVFNPTPAWSPALTPLSDVPFGRQRMVPLEDIQAPSAMLQDLVDESFLALRTRVASDAGWDALATLENAFVPLTSPLEPGMQDDWLYTGRAFSFNIAPLNAGWMVVVREDYGSQVYWRIFLRTRFQDGSQGKPLYALPWNFEARYRGDPRAYEQGGVLAESVPGGYWLDFTTLAGVYGWERLPALSTWRSAFSAARFNEFVLRDGQDWLAAMLEVYPHEAIDTPTPIPSSTPTPTATDTPTRTPYMTRTPRPTNTPWPTRTPTPTRTPYMSRTPRPTNTPWPTVTPRPTQTPWPSRTPRYTATPTSPPAQP